MSVTDAKTWSSGVHNASPERWNASEAARNETATRPGRRARRRGRRDRVVAVEHEQVVIALVLEDARFRSDVVVERAVPVEMVFGEAEQHRDPRPERLRERELERGHLGHEDIDIVVDGVEEGATDVAGRGGAPPGRFEHRRRQARHRRLPVGARDGDDRHARPVGCQVDLAPDGDARGARGNDRRMRFGDERARDDHRARRGRFGVPVRAGRGEDLRARVEHPAHARVVRVAARVVVGDVDFPPLAAEPARDRLARRGQTDHEGPRHSSPNRRKSA